REMARPGSPQTRLQMAGQIIRRAQRFENTHGVTIGRVMEAPHATFVPATFPALLAVGFEAAMVTPDLLQHDPGSAPWPAAFGLAGDGEFGGLPWIPRIRWRQGWHTDVLLAAFLRQPMVVAGHHNDIRDGLEAMGEIANTINRQGEVTWSPTDELVRRRARRRIEGETLFVKTYAVRATISVPEGIRSLVLERGGPTGSFAGPITVSQEGQTIASLASSDPVVGPISVRGRGEVSVLRTVPKAVGPDDVPAPRTSVWPVIRKVIMEVRDRSQPVRHRATRRRSRPATAVPVSGGA
ncbi:MAG TPA: hypothetical protein PLX89_15635, partial [Verrucomicrobiota bacterium]|nr:hypothetical protein [Verrucomicrobiota bacterium]